MTEAAGMVAGCVVEEIPVIGLQKGRLAEGRDAGAADMAQPCVWLHHKALLERELRFSEAGIEAAAEIYVLPPRRGKCRVETAHVLPHSAPHQPCGGVRLWHLDRRCWSSGGNAPARQTKGESPRRRKMAELPPMLRSALHVLEQRDCPSSAGPIDEKLHESVDCAAGDDGVRVEQEQIRLVALEGAAVGGVRKTVVLFEGDDLDLGKLAGQPFGTAVARTRVHQNNTFQLRSAIIEE